MIKSENIRIIIYIIFMFVVSRVSMYLLYMHEFTDPGVLDCIHKFNLWDTGWYEGYARGIIDGNYPWNYDGQQAWAFFPLYPLILAACYRLLRFKLDIIVIGTLVSNACFLLTEYIAYKYIMLTRKSLKIAYAFIAFMSLGVYTFYFTITYTEALYIFLMALSFYFMKKESYIAMGAAGALLSASRNTGVLFVFVILVWRIMVYVSEHGKEGRIGDFIILNLKNERLVLGTVMVPAGIFAYIAFLTRKVGDGFAFVHVQRSWGRDYKGFFHVLYNSFVDVFPPDYLGVATLIAFLLIIYLTIRYRNYDEMILPVFVLFMGGSSGFMSVPRFMIGSYTLMLGFCEEYAGMNRTARILISACAFLFELVLIRQWLLENAVLW